MKKISVILSLAVLLSLSFGTKAQNTMWIHQEDGIVEQISTAEVESMGFTSQMQNMFLFIDGVENSWDVSKISMITFSSFSANDEQGVYVHFNGDTATVQHNYDSEDFVVEVNGANVVITSNMGVKDISYYLYGSSSDGSFTLESDSKYNVVLSGLNLTSTTTAPVQLTKKKDRTVVIADGTYNVLTDTENSSEKSTLKTKGATTFSGNGTLVINANKKHGISSDYDITITDGNLTVNNTADASKGIKSDMNITISGGNVTVNPTGSLVLEEAASGYDPSYCAGISADSNISVSGTAVVNVTVASSNAAGRGLKADGNIYFDGGVVTVTSNGDGGTYTDSTGATDSYKSSCIKADGDIYFNSGEITCLATGTGGKCVNADGNIYIGKEDSEDNTSLVLSLTTTGEKFYVSGSGEDADYSNPKALKAKGNLYVNSGTINVSTANDGGEGLESKDTAFINGGMLTLNTYDDAINAKHHIQINGGLTYAHSTGNDAIDANGTLTVTGGTTIAIGTTSPEEGFDCDQNTFTIKGGILVGVGGGTSDPTNKVCTQNYIVYNGITNGTALNITDAGGTDILTIQLPTISGQQGGGPGGQGGGPKSGKTSTKGPGDGPGGQGGGPNGGSNGFTLLFSSPNLTTGTCTLKQGGTISGGTDFNGYYTGATYSNGTSTTVNVTSAGASE